MGRRGDRIKIDDLTGGRGNSERKQAEIE